jgi:DNA-binding NtrC family response regulator
MKKNLRVLILEDLPTDAELAQRELKTVLKNYAVKVVDTEEGYVQALKLFKPDLIISDYLLPEFNGLSALKIRNDNCPFTPFILLTGSINEETAVEVMKAGANDYVIKEHIIRLGPAVLNAIDKKKIEFENEQAQEKLISRNKELEAWYDVSVDRELKVLDLKKEINELLEKSGEKPKYKIPV